MAGIFIFTAGNPDARKNLDHSIRNPIPPETVLSLMPDSERNELERVLREHGGFYAWGAEPGPVNKNTWGALVPGDWALCVYDSTYHYAARVVAKYENERLAEAVWGRNFDSGATWQYMYFLSKPVKVDVSLGAVADYLRSGYRGFTRTSEDKLNAIARDFGSLDSFIERRFLGRRSATYPLRAFKVEIIEGSIAQHERSFDAIVSSDDNYLSHSGGVSAALWDAAGPKFEPHQGRKRPQLALGAVHVTEAGQLPARFLLHAVTVDFDENRTIAPAHLPVLYAELFRVARELGCASVAMPLIGGGSARVAPEASAAAFAEAARSASDESLRHVALFLLPEQYLPLAAIVEREFRDSATDYRWAIAAAVKSLPLNAAKKPLQDWVSIGVGPEQRIALASLLGALVNDLHDQLASTTLWDPKSDRLRASMGEVRLLLNRLGRSHGLLTEEETSATRMALASLAQALVELTSRSQVSGPPSHGPESHLEIGRGFLQPGLNWASPERVVEEKAASSRFAEMAAPDAEPATASPLPPPVEQPHAPGEESAHARASPGTELSPALVPSVRPEVEGGTGPVRALHRLIVERLSRETLARIHRRLERSGYRGDPDFRLMEHLVQAVDLSAVLIETFDLATLEEILEAHGVSSEEPLTHRAAADRLLPLLGFPPPRRARGLHAAQVAVADARVRLHSLRLGDPAIRGTVVDIGVWLECICQALLRFISLAAFNRPPEVLLRGWGDLQSHMPLAHAGLGQLFGYVDALGERIRREPPPQFPLLGLSSRPLLPPHGKGHLPTIRNDFAHRSAGSDAMKRAEDFLHGAADLLAYLADPEDRVFPRVLVVTGIHYDRWGRRLVYAEPEGGGQETIFTDAVLRPGEIYFMHPRSNPIRVDPLLVPAGDFSFPD